MGGVCCYQLFTPLTSCVDLVDHVLCSCADPSPVEPALFVLSPLQPEGVSVKQLADEVCLATGFHPKEGDMVLNVKERQVTTNTSNSVMSQKDKTYYYAGFINETIYSCELHNTLANNEMGMRTAAMKIQITLFDYVRPLRFSFSVIR